MADFVPSWSLVVVAAAAAALLGPAGVLAQPSCPEPATVSVVVDNQSADTRVELTLDGELVDPLATCQGTGLTNYAAALACTGTGLVSCGQIEGLRPGAWVNRVLLGVNDPLSGPQDQRRRAVFIGGARGVFNVLAWTVYPRTFVVPEASAAALRATLDAAAAYTAVNPGTALVSFSPAAFPGAAAPRTITLAEAPPAPLLCEPDGTRCAGLRLTGSRLVVDALDRRGERGAVVLSAGDRAQSVLRVLGNGNVLRGLVLVGSSVESSQSDAVVLSGPASRDNRLEQCLVVGPARGDAVSTDGGAGPNVVDRCEIREAQGKGVKVTGDARAVLHRSCIHDNRNGGVQASFGGQATVLESVVQDNVPGSASNALAVDGAGESGASVLITAGNVVRFAGARGLSVTGDALASFTHDYVADNQFAGSKVATAGGHPGASFEGVAFVCNRNAGISGTCEGISADEDIPVPCEVASDCCEGPDGSIDPDCRAVCSPLSFSRGFGAAQSGAGGVAPTVFYGDAAHPGRNAFAWNRNAPRGANFNLQAPGAVVSALGNQWEHCGTGELCDMGAVAAEDLQLAAGARVTLGTPAGPRAGAPVLRAVTPARPRSGDVVRVYGENFNAIEGSACAGTTEPFITPCAVTNLAVEDRNRQTNATRIRIVAPDGSVQTLYPDAVTPTMLAFHMPYDCFASLILRVAKLDPAGTRVERSIRFCDAPGCIGQPEGTPCDDGNACTLEDRCGGEDDPTCRGVPVDCTGTCKTCDPVFGCGPSPATVPCEDGDACTVGDHCAGDTDACVPGPVGVCDDGDPCTDEVCDPSLGCVASFNRARCDDGDPCTRNDVCSEGQCGGAPLVCEDSDVCDGTETCNPNLGCVQGLAPVCNDAASCTVSGVMCSVETVRRIANEAPPLDCFGRCPCGFQRLLTRAERLIERGAEAASRAGCRRRLRAAGRVALALKRRLTVLGERGCVTPVTRATRLIAEAVRLRQRTVTLAKGYCARR